MRFRYNKNIEIGIISNFAFLPFRIFFKPRIIKKNGESM